MGRQLRVSLLGHKDHGKSTLIGRLLYETGSVTDERIREARATAGSLGKGFEFAFLLDSFEEEREGGYTLDTTRAQVRHKDAIYDLIDVPGHKELVKNMLTGTSLADAAILMVSALPEERLRDETRLHLYLAGMLGIKRIVVAINKMDAISYSEDEFRRIADEIAPILRDSGFGEACFVPVSAKEGDNVAQGSGNMPWYSGKTILQHLEGFSDIDHAGGLRRMPARMFIQDVYRLGDEDVIVGRLETGRLARGQEIRVLPKGITARIRRMMIRNMEADEALPGENVGMVLEKDGGCSRGDLCVPSDDQVAPVTSIQARIFCLPGNELRVSEELGIVIASAEAGAAIESISSKKNALGSDTGDDSRILGWEAAEVTISLDRPMAFERFQDMPFTGRFIVTKEGKVTAVGISI